MLSSVSFASRVRARLRPSNSRAVRSQMNTEYWSGKPKSFATWWTLRSRRGSRFRSVLLEEGLNQLQTLCSTEINIDQGGSCLRIPTPNPATLPLVKALHIQMPKLLPHTDPCSHAKKAPLTPPSSSKIDPFPSQRKLFQR